MIKKLLPVIALLIAACANSQQWGDYTLYAVQNNTTAYLVDTNGTTYHTWNFNSNAKTGYSSYLEPGGTIVRTVALQGTSFGGGGVCGKVQKVDWNGNLVWDYVCSTTSYCSHHDICPMPNGNVLLIVYERKTAAEATAAGSKYSHEMWPEKIIEVQPTTATTGTVVWEWHVWDHLIQDFDINKNNYGVVKDHPELIDLNFNNNQQTKDWMHANGIDYNPALDQIVLSSHNLNELYVIDHSTTTAEAAGHTGGNSGKGGDILYRWGNPAAYRATGTKIFSVVHDAHWIPPGSPHANYLVGFNNNGISSNKSSVDLISPPYNGYNYTHVTGQAYAPSTYTYRHACNGHSNNESNSQQLPNGNMLVCIAQAGYIYEVDSNNTLLWSKTTSGMVSMAFRYTHCYVEGIIPPAPTITQSNDTLYSSPGYTYQWYYGDLPIPGAILPYHIPTQFSNHYRVRITDSDGCESELSNKYYYLLINVNDLTGPGNLHLYPNPTTGIVNIDTDFPLSEITEIIAYDVFGREIYHSGSESVIDLSDQKEGLYLLIIKVSDGSIISSKIIKKL